VEQRVIRGKTASAINALDKAGRAEAAVLSKKLLKVRLRRPLHSGGREQAFPLPPDHCF